MSTNPNPQPPRKPDRQPMRYRRPEDRHILARRMMRLGELVKDCDQPLVGQAYRALRRAHRQLRQCEQSVHETAAALRPHKEELAATREKAALLPAYVARKVSESPEDDWASKGPPASAVHKRMTRLLGNKPPSRLAESPDELRQALEHLHEVLRQDPAEAGLWKESFVQAVQRTLEELRKATDAVDAARTSHRAALRKLHEQQSWWDYHWEAAEVVILGYYRRIGQEVEVARTFAPLRYRPVVEKNAVSSPEEGENSDPSAQGGGDDAPVAETGDG